LSDHEPSYYEIALTNRQVVVAFVILLVCLMGTFFTGVWVGRGEQAGTAGEERRAERAEPEEQDVEELDFFGGGGEVAPPAGDRVEAPPPDIRVDEAPRRAEESRNPPREDPVVQRNRRGDGQRRTAGEEPADDAAGGEGAALSGQPVAGAGRSPGDPPRDLAPPTTTRPVPTEGRAVEGPVVQVFSSRDREQAQRIVDRLTDGGQPAYLSPVEVEGTTMFRVRIGPFRDRAQAQRVADQVKRSFRLDTWITE
jgi:cell division septation protein DedD